MKRIFCIILLTASFLGCNGNVEPGVIPGTDPEGGDVPVPEETIVFQENFDACVMSEGPMIQSDNFKADCQNPLSHIDFQSTEWKTVGSSHICDEEYVRSRGFGSWVYLFRTNERPGCLACGVNPDGKRGIIQSPMLAAIKEISDIEISFDVKPDASMTDNLVFKLCLCGVIVSATLNGRSLDLTENHNGIDHALTISRKNLTSTWNRVVVRVENATNGTMLYWAGESSSTSLNHGFYLDNIKVIETKAYTRPSNCLRVLYWNIQNGMWSDQEENFANFRAFVKKYDPDVCVWCEGQSIYKTGTTQSCAVSERYFPSAWPEFAKTYGHAYTAIGGYRIYADDYFPQVITSRYPITTLVKITETDAVHQNLADSYIDGKSHASEYHATCPEGYCPVAHGAAIQRICVNGKNVNFVTLHLWPHAYSYYAKFVIKNTSYDSANSAGGNLQRENEIKYICSQSIENPAFSSEDNWLMMGDFNTRSRLDNWRYALPEDSPFLSSHDYILNHTFYKDIIGLRYPGHFFATRTWASDAAGNYPPRYDFMYASPTMYERVENALVLNEEWTNMVWSMSNFYNSSDHRPILVDFRM